MIWFTSDWHFNHKNIIKYCNRPYKNVDEMNAGIVDNIFKCYKTGDIMYFLGDYAFGPTPKIDHVLQSIDLVKVCGNHDPREGLPYAIHLRARGLTIHMSHSVDFERIDSAFDLYLCGHVHDKWRFKKWGKQTIINVGVDVWDMCPVSIEGIIKLHKDVQRGRVTNEG